MAGGDVRYTVSVDDKGFAQKIESFDKALENLERITREADASAKTFGNDLVSKLIPAFTAADLAAGVLRKTYGALKNMVLDGIQGALKEEQSELRLKVALESMGKARNGAVANMLSFAQQQSRVTLYTQEEVRAAAALLAQLTRLDADGIKAILPGIEGLASTLGPGEGGLHGATMMVVRAVEGNTTGLQRAGVVIDDTIPKGERLAEIQRRLAELFPRATAETETTAGAIKQAGKAYDDFREKLGKVLIESFGFKVIAEGVTKALDDQGRSADITTKSFRELASAQASAGRAGGFQFMFRDYAKGAEEFSKSFEAMTLSLLDGRQRAINPLPIILRDTTESEKAAAEKAKKLEESLKALIDKADPLRAKYSGILDDMTLVDGAFKTGKISASDYGKVMGWLQEQLRDVDEAATRLGETALPRVNAALGRWAISNAPGLFASRVRKSLSDTAKDVSSFITKLQPIATAFTNIGNQIAANETIRLDNEYKKRLDYINRTITDEDAKQKAIEALEAEYQLKRSEAARKAAVVQKAASLAQAIINTAEAYTATIGKLGFFGIPLATIVAALGAAQCAIIAAQPIPLAEGGYFKKRTLLPGPGRDYEIGEAGEEIASPVPVMRKIVREEAGASGHVYNITIAPGAVVVNAQTLDDAAIDRARTKLAAAVFGQMRFNTALGRT